MQKETIKKIADKIGMIKGFAFARAGRAITLGWFIFKKEETEYAIHSESFFRFSKDDQILFTQHDIFYEHELSKKKLIILRMKE